MCGIAGYRIVEPQTDRWSADLPRAIEALHHRGPDDGGLWFEADRRVGLGHRRLAILDLSPLGHQPMVSRCGAWAMVYNGEIYNFKEIRAALEPLGHAFSGTGDSEVILAAFSEWGVDAVSRFIGMFAIALWHKPTRRLHLIRDRLGVKPLHYFWNGREFCFGSELRALRAFGGWPVEIDADALNDYLRYNYINDPRTIYQHVFKLPPAHRLVLDESGQVELVRYWNVLEHVGRRHTVGEAALADELEALMVDAFRYRMVSDVPVGVFLSGGVDSSIVAALLQKHANQQIKTFTIGFDDPQYDESPFADDVARHIGTDHHRRMLRIDDAMRLLPKWAELYDEPFGDESGIPTYMVSQVAAEQVKVVLSADGGDELFSGYDGYTAMLSQWDRIKGIPLPLRDLAGGVVNGLGAAKLEAYIGGRASTALGQRMAVASGKLGRLGARVGARGVGDLFDRALAHFDPEELAQLTGHPVTARANADGYPGVAGEQLCLWDLHNYLPGDVLAKVDRASMATSIEGREPLLDHRLVEFAFSLPFEMRRGALGPKHLLKQVLYRHVPRSLVDRPKRGVAVPVKHWLAGDLRSFVDDHLAPSRVARQGIFDCAMVRDYVRRLHAGDPGVRQRVWLLVAFQMWHQRWMA
jgi:asparagine synthase (glutamine-hydrolysing)